MGVGVWVLQGGAGCKGLGFGVMNGVLHSCSLLPSLFPPLVLLAWASHGSRGLGPARDSGFQCSGFGFEGSNALRWVCGAEWGLGCC